MDPYKRVFIVGILTALVLFGLSAYFFMFFQALHQKQPVTREQLEQMSKSSSLTTFSFGRQRAV